MIQVLKQFEIWRLSLYLVIICLGFYLLFYGFRNRIVSGLFPNEVVVTTQGSFNKDEVVIKMLNEASLDTIMIYQNGRAVGSFKPIGLVQFFIYQNHQLIADFEHIKEDPNVGNAYHFYLSANADSIFMDMRVEGVGSGR